MPDETPKILEGGPVTFGPSNAKPDLLSTETALQSNDNFSAVNKNPDLQEIEKKAVENIIEAYKLLIPAISANLIAPVPPELLSIVQDDFIIAFFKEGFVGDIRYYNPLFSAITPSNAITLENYLTEKIKQKYGQFIFSTKMWEETKIGLDKKNYEQFLKSANNILLYLQMPLFPDFRSFNGGLTQIISSPYISVFSAPRTLRVPLASMLYLEEQKGSFDNLKPYNKIISMKNIRKGKEILSMKSILEYAELKGDANISKESIELIYLNLPCIELIK